MLRATAAGDDRVLIDAVPRDAVDEAVGACGMRERRSDETLPAQAPSARNRVSDAGLCLSPDDDYEEVATRVTGSLDRFGCWDAAWTIPTVSVSRVPPRSAQPVPRLWGW